jgi:5'-nucleotidase
MRKILYIDMDNVLVDFQSGIDRLDVPTQIEFEGRYDEVPGIFSLMEPMPGAVDAYHTLAEVFDTFILSTAPWLNSSAWSDKNLWVREHLGDVATVTKRLILTHHKHLNHGDFLIDDRPNNGADRFAGTWIEFGHRDWPDWPAVTDYLLDRA